MRKEIKAKMKDTADYIFHNPELSLKEYKSSRKLAEFLESPSGDPPGAEEKPGTGDREEGGKVV